MTTREHFIPLRPADLVQKLADDPAVTIFEREQFRQFCQLVEATIHHDYRSRLAELKTAYAPFDPDCDAAAGVRADAARNAAAAAGGCSTGSTRSWRGPIIAACRASNWKRPSAPPATTACRCTWTWRSSSGWKSTAAATAACPAPAVRGALCGRTSRNSSRRTAAWRSSSASSSRRANTGPLDTQAVILKLFKNIPQQDVETLLPGANIRIGWLEQAKIVLPTLSGVGLTLFKLLKGAAAVAFASLYGLLAFLALVSGVIGYGLRSFYGYLRTREKYQLSLTRSLYFQNLDNNAGVLYHLLNEAEEQEFREVVLGWWLLWRGGLQGSRQAELDAAAERWLMRALRPGGRF